MRIVRTMRKTAKNFKCRFNILTVIFPGQNAKKKYFILFLRTFLSRYLFPFWSHHFNLKLRILTAAHPMYIPHSMLLFDHLSGSTLQFTSLLERQFIIHIHCKIEKCVNLIFKSCSEFFVLQYFHLKCISR